MAAEPWQRRPTPRRGSARVVADARSRRPDGVVSADRLRRRGSGRRDPCGAPAGLARGAAGVRSVTMHRDISSLTPSWALGVRLLMAGSLGVVVAIVLVSCGSSGKGLIPTANAGPLQSDFEAVAQAAQTGGGNCTATTEAINKTEQDFAALPATI